MTTLDTPRTEAGAPPLPSDALIIVPVRNLVLFPGLIAPVTLARAESIAAAQEAVKAQRPVGLLLQRHPEMEEPKSTDLYTVGTTATILRYLTTPDGPSEAEETTGSAGGDASPPFRRSQL